MVAGFEPITPHQNYKHITLLCIEKSAQAYAYKVFLVPLTMKPSLNLVALIPAYNEGENIRQVIESTQPYVDRVVVCDDGSSHDMQTILDTADVDILKHPNNLGYGAALKTLFKHGKENNATMVICVNADGQHNPA